MDCTFASDDPSVKIDYIFYVWDYIISPLIMGMEFLSATECFTSKKYRLEFHPQPHGGPFEVMVINNPQRRLRCRLDRVILIGDEVL